MLKPKGRIGLLREEHGTECAEIYSPPRVTHVVSEMGLRAAWSLDVTIVDPIDGMLWDFSFEAKRKRAAELLERDKPVLLVACPMCGPFGALQAINYAKLSREEVTAKLRDATAHVKFALDMCLRQYRGWRFFVFEHPASASFWAALMIKHVMQLEGAHMARFDFCQLGMGTVNAAGEKLTSIMTTLEALDRESEPHSRECQPRCPWDLSGQMENQFEATEKSARALVAEAVAAGGPPR